MSHGPFQLYIFRLWFLHRILPTFKWCYVQISTNLSTYYYFLLNHIPQLFFLLFYNLLLRFPVTYNYSILNSFCMFNQFLIFFINTLYLVLGCHVGIGFSLYLKLLQFLNYFKNNVRKFYLYLAINNLIFSFFFKLKVHHGYQ